MTSSFRRRLVEEPIDVAMKQAQMEELGRDHGIEDPPEVVGARLDVQDQRATRSHHKTPPSRPPQKL